MTEANNKENKIYEVGYLLVPELAESSVAEEVGNLKSLILDTLGGTEITSEMPKAIELAYGMEKRIGSKKELCTRAYFGWIKFELPRDRIGEVKSALEKNNKIIRFLIIGTVRENTMLVKKILARPSDAAVHKSKELHGVPAMSEEELDKTIEELVIE